MNKMASDTALVNEFAPDGLLHMKTVLDDLEVFSARIRIETDLQHICHLLIERLAVVYVPNSVEHMKQYYEYQINFGNSLEQLMRRSDQFQKILLFCLQTSYNIINSNNKASLASAILFSICDQDRPKVLRELLNEPSNTDDATKKVILKLCTWLRIYPCHTNLNQCIIDMFEELQVGIHFTVFQY